MGVANHPTRTVPQRRTHPSQTLIVSRLRNPVLSSTSFLPDTIQSAKDLTEGILSADIKAFVKDEDNMNREQLEDVITDLFRVGPRDT